VFKRDQEFNSAGLGTISLPVTDENKWFGTLILWVPIFNRDGVKFEKGRIWGVQQNTSLVI